MTYCIMNVMYGYPLRKDDDYGDLPEELQAAVEEEVEGFTSYYSGSGEMPVAFAVALDDFDEATAYVDVNQIQMSPTKAQEKELQENFDALPPELKVLVTRVVERPIVFILPSSS